VRNKLINTFIQQKCIQLIYKSYIKAIYNVNAVLMNFIFNIDNNKNISWASNHHIRMISEGSCDTEDLSNDAENSAK